MRRFGWPTTILLLVPLKGWGSSDSPKKVEAREMRKIQAKEISLQKTLTLWNICQEIEPQYLTGSLGVSELLLSAPGICKNILFLHAIWLRPEYIIGSLSHS